MFTTAFDFRLYRVRRALFVLVVTALLCLLLITPVKADSQTKQKEYQVGDVIAAFADDVALYNVSRGGFVVFAVSYRVCATQDTQSELADASLSGDGWSGALVSVSEFDQKGKCVFDIEFDDPVSSIKAGSPIFLDALRHGDPD